MLEFQVWKFFILGGLKVKIKNKNKNEEYVSILGWWNLKDFIGQSNKLNFCLATTF